MKTKFKRVGLLGKIYTIVDPCCEFTKLFKKVRLDEYRGFIAMAPYNNLLVINYCGNCGAKTEVVEQDVVGSEKPKSDSTGDTPTWNT